MYIWNTYEDFLKVCQLHFGMQKKYHGYYKDFLPLRHSLYKGLLVYSFKYVLLSTVPGMIVKAHPQMWGPVSSK